MSDAKFRKIERRWKADPSQEHTLQYLYELIRVGYDVELGLLDADLLRSYREQLQNDLRSLPLQRISILGRGLHEVMDNIQTYQQGVPLVDIPDELITRIAGEFMGSGGSDPLARQTKLRTTVALYRSLQTAIPEVDLTDEYEFAVISLGV